MNGHPVTYRVGVDNLTNEKYWLTSFGFILNQGVPRTVRASCHVYPLAARQPLRVRHA